MKNENAILTIAVGIGFVVVMAFAWIFMSGMIDILKRGQGVGGGVTTNVVMRSAVAVNVAGVENKVEKGDMSIITAYELLSNELSSWMAIMGLFATVFGLVIPIGGYLLQQRSLKEERDRIKDDIEVLRKVQNDVDDLKSRQEELQGAFKQTNKPFWAALERCFEYSVISNPIASRTYKLQEKYKVANLLLSMELMLDGCVLVGDRELLLKKIVICKLVVEELRNDVENWSGACCAVREGGERTPLVEGIRYLELVKSDSDAYRWLKELFSEIAPEKMP